MDTNTENILKKKLATSSDIGCVYIASFCGYRKIGMTKGLSPKERMEQLNKFHVIMPEDILLNDYMICDNYRAHEELLHSALSDFCVGGEWFEIDSEEYDDIIRYFSVYSVFNLQKNIEDMKYILYFIDKYCLDKYIMYFEMNDEEMQEYINEEIENTKNKKEL